MDAFKSDGDIGLVRWNNNNVILEPIGQAKRWKGNQFVNIDQQYVIRH